MEMKYKKFTLKLLVFIVSVVFCVENVVAQEANEKPSFSINAVGLSLGWYNPSLEYWKENVNSEFRDADFNGAISVKGFYERMIVRNLYGQISLGYWQSSVEDVLQGFGNTKMLLTGIPIGLDIIYHIEPISFSIITPYIGMGGEYVFIQYKKNFEQKDNPDPVNGSTFMGNGVFGIEANLSENFAVDFEFRYKFGSYNQEFLSVKDPIYEYVKEEISLNGPFIGISLKYLL